MDTAIPASAPAVRDTPVPSVGAAILRDIARGGIAGLIVGIVVAGLGGRLVMRLAALIVPESRGQLTENGNRIGDITFEGSTALLVFSGLATAILLGFIWVVISPWLPGRLLSRALVTMPVAVALGGQLLIQRFNPDFVILGYHPLVAAILVALVALSAPAMAVTDAWLDRHLPRPARLAAISAAVYGGLAVIGGAFGTLIIVAFAREEDLWSLFVTTVAAGVCTLAWWVLRFAGRSAPPPDLVLVARGLLAAGTVLGLAAFLPELVGALGIF